MSEHDPAIAFAPKRNNPPRSVTRGEDDGIAVAILLMRMSECCSDYWTALAEELDVLVVDESVYATMAPRPAVAAVVVVAGGREADLPLALAGLTAPANVPVIAVGASTAYRLAARAVAAGAADYFALPDDGDTLRESLRSAIARRRATQRHAVRAQRDANGDAFREIAGDSPALHEALARAARVVHHANATVLITGETGTGKELLARALHYGGPRATAPFVELNCAAVPTHLLESEMFGHEAGAFTDAVAAKPGLFETAEGGTLFLDEVDALALELQSKLLRAIDLRVVRRLGAISGRALDVRIIAATSADLPAAIGASRFREDLFYRLNVVPLTLPPLRDRGDDVVHLAELFLSRFSERYRLPRPVLTPAARAQLLTHPWPGNVRELRNTIERAVLLSPAGTLDLGDLNLAATTAGGTMPIPFPARLADIQYAAAQATLERAGGNRSEAARRLGVSRARLQRLLARGRADASS